MEGKASSLFLVSWVGLGRSDDLLKRANRLIEEQERGGKSVISLLAIIFFLFPHVTFLSEWSWITQNTNTFSSKTPVVCPFGASHFTVTNLPIRQTPFSVTVRDGSDCVHLPAYSLYPGQANISYIFYKTWWAVYMRNKTLAQLEGWPA